NSDYHTPAPGLLLCGLRRSRGCLPLLRAYRIARVSALELTRIERRRSLSTHALHLPGQRCSLPLRIVELQVGRFHVRPSLRNSRRRVDPSRGIDHLGPSRRAVRVRVGGRRILLILRIQRLVRIVVFPRRPLPLKRLQKWQERFEIYLHVWQSSSTKKG